MKPKIAKLPPKTKPKTMSKPEIVSAKGPIVVHPAHDAIVAIGELKPNPRNPNKHPKKQLEILGNIYRETGVRKCAVVSNRSGLLVTGHGSVEAARLIGMEAFPIDFQDFKDETQEHAHMLADNQIAELAEIDPTELAGIMAEMKKAEADVATMTGFSDKEIQEFLNPGKGKGGNRNVSSTGVIQFNIIFDNVEQQQAWFELLKKLKGEYPGDDETIGSRLAKFAKKANGQN